MQSAHPSDSVQKCFLCANESSQHVQSAWVSEDEQLGEYNVAYICTVGICTAVKKNEVDGISEINWGWGLLASYLGSEIFWAMDI